MRGSGVILTILMSGIVLFLNGCFPSNPEDIEVFVRPDRVNVISDSYTLQPPDEVEIHCTKVPELHLVAQKIRPDGMVSFEGVGELKAAGKTPGQLANDIREKVMQMYSLSGENDVNVKIVTYRSSMYYVAGQVYFEGPKVCTGRDTVFTALSAARPTVLAWEKRVQVVRPTREPEVNRARIFEVNYKKMIAHGDLSKDVLLEEGDIIYVPPTVLAAIGMVIEELVRPIGRAFSTVNIVQDAGTSDR